MKERKEAFIVPALQKMSTEIKPIKHFENAEKAFLDAPKKKLDSKNCSKLKRGKSEEHCRFIFQISSLLFEYNDYSECVYNQFTKDYKASSVKTIVSNLTRIMVAVNPLFNGQQQLDEKFIDDHFGLILLFLESINQSSVTYSLLKLIKILMPGSRYGDLKELQEQQETDRKMKYLQKKGEEEQFKFTWDSNT